MILPKGTVDFSRNGGEGEMERMMDLIRSEKRTGYLLVLGEVTDEQGKTHEITSQLLFQDGVPKLCESVVNNLSSKGSNAIYDTLRSMEKAENTIEMHSKIDVGPPLAFFKECMISEKDLDIDEIKEKMTRDRELIRKREEDIKKKEEEKARIRDEVDSWISQGYSIDDYPAILNDEHEAIVKWHGTIVENINEMISIVDWVNGIDDIELKDDRDALLAISKEPKRIDDARRIREGLESKISHIREKREEMEKWVNLWKDEGYNTEEIEKTLKSDLNTAWNNLTKFMDDIQILKEYREELDEIRARIKNESFGPEIREIDFLLNDPMELESIGELIRKLKDSIEYEREEKERMMADTREWESRGYDLGALEERMSKRLDDFRSDHDLFLKNISRIEKIRQDLGSMDRRDLNNEIDTLLASMKEPFRLSDYEVSAGEIREKIDLLNSRRKALIDEMEMLNSQGFDTTTIEQKTDSPLKELSTLLEDFRSKVSKLKDLQAAISDMDHRWLEDDFGKIEGLLKDTSKIDEIEQGMKELQQKIDERERKRQKVKDQMTEWKQEGFDVSKLEEAIEEDENTFTSIHQDLSEKIGIAKNYMKELNGLNTKYFPAEKREIEADLHDPYKLEGSRIKLDTLKEKVGNDWDIRNELIGWMDELKEKGWDLVGIEDITDTSPNMISDRFRALKNDMDELEGALSDMDSWDPLEMKWRSSMISEVKDRLHRVSEKDDAMARYKDLKEEIARNHDTRQRIRNMLEEWKEKDLVVNRVEEMIEEEIETLQEGFSDLEQRVGKLEELTLKFDSLGVDHFRSEAEKIEFRLNDPYSIEEIENDLQSLIEMIAEDEDKREEFRTRIENYIREGFTGARKLDEVMNEDISIVEIEFKNFEKEVQLLKKYIDSTGFVPPEKTKPAPAEEEVEDETEEQPDSKQAEKSAEEETIQTESLNNLEEFIVGVPNEVAYNAIIDAVAQPGVACNPLLILGDEGCGKTHLLQFARNRMENTWPEMNLTFMSGGDFLANLERYRNEENMEAFRDIFRGSDAMIIDDLDEFKDSEEGQNIFINIMTGMLDNGKQIILSSKRDIKAIPKIADQIRASLDTGKSVDMEGTDEEFNRKIVASLGKGKINENVASHLSQTVLGSVRQVKEAIEEILNNEIPDDDSGLLKAKEIIDKINEDSDHRELTEALESTLKDIRVDDTEETVICTNCNKDLPSDSPNCPHCGAIFEEVEMKECPVCKELVDMEKNSCPNCGIEF